MSQFRQDFITKGWVIVAPERAKRPDQFARETHRKERLPHNTGCPFCKGNESLTPSTVYSVGRNDDWQLRVIPNKFAAVNPNTRPIRKTEGEFLNADGFGIAEVVVETPRHDTSPALMSTEEIKLILYSYVARYTALSMNENVDLINIFRNHGPSAGTSIEHPHSQIIATPIVPLTIRQIMQQARVYHDTFGKCPYCVMLAEEISQGTRMIMETKEHVAFCPYASRTPFEIRILPKRHYSRLDGIRDDEIQDLAETLRIVLKKLHVGLNDPDYNYVLHTSPTSDGELHYDHWQLIITPRITTPAGFEIGSGIFINIMPPEQAASFLREVKID